jgi:hypothetical protein
VRYFKELPCFAIWEPSVTRNKIIFKENSLEVSIVQTHFKECSKSTKRPSHRVIKDPTINQYYSYDSLNGASQGTPGSCGTGAIVDDQVHGRINKFVN